MPARTAPGQAAVHTMAECHLQSDLGHTQTLPRAGGSLVTPCHMHAGGSSLEIDQASFSQEPGSGVVGTVGVTTVAVGTLEWVQQHCPGDQAAKAPASQKADPRQFECAPSYSQSHDETSDTLLCTPPSLSTEDLPAPSAQHLRASSSLDEQADGVAGRTASGGQASTSGASGGMIVFVGINGRLAGSLEVQDRLRPDAAATITGLRSSGAEAVLLSGGGPLQHALGSCLCLSLSLSTRASRTSAAQYRGHLMPDGACQGWQ